MTDDQNSILLTNENYLESKQKNNIFHTSLGDISTENLIDFCNESNRYKFDQLLEQIRDRLTTSDCIETHKDKLFGLSLIDALTRSKEFDRFTNKDFCSWGSKTM